MLPPLKTEYQTACALTQQFAMAFPALERLLSPLLKKPARPPDPPNDCAFSPNDFLMISNDSVILPNDLVMISNNSVMISNDFSAHFPLCRPSRKSQKSFIHKHFGDFKNPADSNVLPVFHKMSNDSANLSAKPPTFSTPPPPNNPCKPCNNSAIKCNDSYILPNDFAMICNHLQCFCNDFHPVLPLPVRLLNHLKPFVYKPSQRFERKSKGNHAMIFLQICNDLPKELKKTLTSPRVFSSETGRPARSVLRLGRTLTEDQSKRITGT